MRPEGFYRQHFEQYSAERQRATKRLRWIAFWRFAAFLVALFGFLHLWPLPTWMRWAIGPLGVVGFLYGLWQHRKQSVIQRQANRHVELAEAELASLSGHHAYWHAGDGFRESGHAYSEDLDLFGEHSLYRMVCRAFLPDGQRALAERLSVWQTDHASIVERQQAVQEVQGLAEWRMHTTVAASIAAEESNRLQELRTWASDTSHRMKGLFRWGHMLTPIWALGIICGYATGLLSTQASLVAIALPLSLVARHFKQTNATAEILGHQHAGLHALADLFLSMQRQTFRSLPMSTISGQAKGASEALRELGRIANAFDNRNNVLVSVLLNALLGWDFWCLRRLEQWHDAHAVSIGDWLDALAELEVNVSLGAFAFNRSDVTWPALDTNGAIHAVKLGHPMIQGSHRVDNDFELDSRSFSIVTGANMAGKSTFLRTLGINLVLAQAGAPVVAESMSFRSIPLFSSMRTTDALEAQTSYFYAELKRLQQLVELLEAGEARFVILDEILKGTNSKDKAEGSRKFLEKLTRLPAQGVVATHDLSLCAVADAFDQVDNRYFDVTIAADDLAFDYVLRDGICQNMNATFLMDRMGITR